LYQISALIAQIISGLHRDYPEISRPLKRFGVRIGGSWQRYPAFTHLRICTFTREPMKPGFDRVPLPEKIKADQLSEDQGSSGDCLTKFPFFITMVFSP